MSAYGHHVGIDVSADTLSVSLDGHIPFLVEQTPKGWQTCIHQLLKAGCTLDKTLIVMEASGTYVTRPAELLHRTGFHVSIINPLKSYYFARTRLQNSKTDALDAQNLAYYAQHFTPRRWLPPPAIQEAIYQCLVQREMYLHILQQIRNQQSALQLRIVDPSDKTATHPLILALLQKEVKTLEQKLKQLLKQSSPYQQNAGLLLTIKGMGIITVGWLLVLTQNFAFMESAEELASFCGLVPHRRTSGKLTKRKRRVRYAGSRRLRKMLYLSTLSAAQHNPILKKFYDRMKAQGKANKVARIATARKMAHLVWGIIAHQKAFDPHYDLI